MVKSDTSDENLRPAKLTTSRLQNISAMMAGLLSNIASGTQVWTGRFVASLHETRRQQAAEVFNRYRHLIYDADADRQFGIGHRANDPDLPFVHMRTNENDKSGRGGSQQG